MGILQQGNTRVRNAASVESPTRVCRVFTILKFTIATQSGNSWAPPEWALVRICIQYTTLLFLASKPKCIPHFQYSPDSSWQGIPHDWTCLPFFPKGAPISPHICHCHSEWEFSKPKFEEDYQEARNWDSQMNKTIVILLAALICFFCSSVIGHGLRSLYSVYDIFGQ